MAPSRKMGGIERALSVLANEWAEQGFEVVYVSCLKSDPFYKLHKSIDVIEPNFKRSVGIFNKLTFYPRLILFIRKNVIQQNPNRVLVFGDFFSPVTLLALLSTKYPVYISDRTIPDYPFKFPIPQLKKWLYPKAAGFIAQTQRAKDYKIKHFGKKLNIEVISNALPEFASNAIVTKLNNNKIIYVGRFAWEKDPEILIQAMFFVAKKFPDWKLEMAGTGPLLEPMKVLVEKLNLNSNVFFLEKVENVSSLYQSASILVLPSVIEGFPNTLIEGMSFGLSCVCFNDIPYEDIITNQIEGCIVTKRTPEFLAATIENLIENKDLREKLGSNAQFSVQRFDKEKISKKFLEFMKL